MGKDAEANQTIGREMVRECLRQCGELEERFSAQRKVVNQQGRALEAIAQVITEERTLRTALEVRIAWLERRWWAKLWAWARATADAGGYIPVRPSAGKVTITKIAEDAAAADDGPASAPDHIHNYVRDTPFLYKCVHEGCGKRASLDEIAAESTYLRQMATADPSGIKH